MDIKIPIFHSNIYLVLESKYTTNNLPIYHYREIIGIFQENGYIVFVLQPSCAIIFSEFDVEKQDPELQELMHKGLKVDQNGIAIYVLLRCSSDCLNPKIYKEKATKLRNLQFSI